ncbi:hypothetical protein [Arthrobacter sp. MMS24-S77]
MSANTHDHPFTITATNREVFERELNHAVKLTQEKAMTEGLRGILVTHDAPGRFTVALDDDVPFGLTREKFAW